MLYILIVIAFLLGSIPSAYIIGRWVAQSDIRKYGSGNVGTTNVLRTYGIWPALLTLACDAGKGVLAVGLAKFTGDPVIVACCGLAVTLGHCYTPFLKFKGGKALATAAGVAIFLMPYGCCALIALFVIVVLISRYVSLGGVVVAAMLPVMALLMHYPSPYIVMSILLAILIIYRHWENIKRIRQGTESRIGEKAKA